MAVFHHWLFQHETAAQKEKQSQRLDFLTFVLRLKQYHTHDETLGLLISFAGCNLRTAQEMLLQTRWCGYHKLIIMYKQSNLKSNSIIIQLGLIPSLAGSDLRTSTQFIMVRQHEPVIKNLSHFMLCDWREIETNFKIWTSIRLCWKLVKNSLAIPANPLHSGWKLLEKNPQVNKQ